MGELGALARLFRRLPEAAENVRTATRRSAIRRPYPNGTYDTVEYEHGQLGLRPMGETLDPSFEGLASPEYLNEERLLPLLRGTDRAVPQMSRSGVLQMLRQETPFDPTDLDRHLRRGWFSVHSHPLGPEETPPAVIPSFGPNTFSGRLPSGEWLRDHDHV